MPVETCTKNKKPGFRWGKQGFCYTYTPSNAAGKERARRQAAAQGRAIEDNRGN